ncbi:MAG: hypothetical protein O7H40_06155 [Gammaproteobacteria bacterium]|nr:hypothetical protein [Gammaproteobacteria bacterium]
MKLKTAIALTLVLGLSAAPALAQTGGMPMGGMPNMTPEQAEAMTQQMMQRFGAKMGLDPEALRNASPEERKEMMRGGADAMAERMILQFGGKMGLDPEALRDAPPEEREEMLRGGADAMVGQSMQRMEQMFGMSVEEMQNLSSEDKAEMRARMAARFQPQAVAPPVEPRPLRPAPRRGFPDGSVALPVTADYGADLVVDEPPERELLLVAVDLPAREIVWRETLTTPFEKHLRLLDIAPDPSVLILELIDPDTHRVFRRYRPVAAASE